MIPPPPPSTLSALFASCLPLLKLCKSSHLVELFHRVRLQLIKELEVLLLQQFVPVDPAGLVQVDFQQV